MIRIDADTNGHKIKYRAVIIDLKNPQPKKSICYLDLEIGDAEISINFKDTPEFLNFCKQHNFNYEDQRQTSQTGETPAKATPKP